MLVNVEDRHIQYFGTKIVFHVVISLAFVCTLLFSAGDWSKGEVEGPPVPGATDRQPCLLTPRTLEHTMEI
jgi:hypothetical protein